MSGPRMWEVLRPPHVNVRPGDCTVLYLVYSIVLYLLYSIVQATCTREYILSHGDCGELSYFKCENLLPEVCLPWTCAKTSASLNKPLLRNFLPRSSGCRSEESLTLVTDTDLTAPVELVGLGLTLTALTACSEEPVCWDEDCLLCYDPLEQHHAPCPASLTVHSCGHLPLPCQPFLCWPRQHNITQLTTVLLRDFRRSLNSC